MLTNALKDILKLGLLTGFRAVLFWLKMTTISILTFFSAILLILYGMRTAGAGLQKATGPKLRSFLLSTTSNRLKGLGIGAFTTALLQSSSATTVMLIGFVGSGLLGLKETMGIILGADIGTTVTVQLIAFKIYDYAVIIIGFGIFLRLVAKRGFIQDIGQAIFGFGFVFFALKLLISSFGPLTQDPFTRSLLLGFSKDPVAGILVSAALTAIFHSSAATLGIAITAAYSGLLTLDAAMPIVLGANIGTSVSAITSSIGGPITAKRVALAHVLFKVIGVIIVLPFLGFFEDMVGHSADTLARQVANAHTFFNIGIAVLFLPFTGPFTRLITVLMPERAVPEKFSPKFLDPIVLSTPSLALAQATRECLRQAEIVEEMLSDSLRVLIRNDEELLEKVEERDNDVDLLDREVKLYLTKLSRESLSQDQAKREIEIILFSDNMENIGDVIDKNLMELARKKIKGRFAFSKEGEKEIIDLHKKVLENFQVGVAAFSGSEPDLAHRLLSKKARISELETELRQAHINRLHMGFRESIDTSAIHLDVLTNLRRINSYVANIAYPILEREKE